MTEKKPFRPSLLSLKIVGSLFVNKKGETIKGIADSLKADYKNVHDCVNALFKGGIIKKEKIGNYNICTLNYSNDYIVQYMKEYNFYVRLKEFRAKYPAEYRIVMEACEKLVCHKPAMAVACLIFGSYAKGEEKKSSDIDLLFLTCYSGEREIEGILRNINAPYQKKFHVIVQQAASFAKDLESHDKLSIAAELCKYLPIIFCGDDIFFKMMMEAAKSW